MADPSIPAGMVPYGPEHPDYPNAPKDWDNGTVRLRAESICEGPYVCRWRHCDAPDDIIAYTPRATEAAKPVSSEVEGLVERLNRATGETTGIARGIREAHNADSKAVITAGELIRLERLLIDVRAALTASDERAIVEKCARVAERTAWPLPMSSDTYHVEREKMRVFLAAAIRATAHGVREAG